MENNNKEILIDNFLKNNTIFLLSSFVSNMLHKTLHSIEIKRSNNDTVVFCFDIQFDEKCANFLNIVHGGSIAILRDNVTNMCLYEIAKSRYKTLDINLSYKYQTLLNVKYKFEVTIEKIKYKTVFITCSIKDNTNKEYVSVNIIKSLIPTSKL